MHEWLERVSYDLVTHLQSIQLRCSETEVFGVFCLLADLIVGVQTAARAPFAHSFSGAHGGVG